MNEERRTPRAVTAGLVLALLVGSCVRDNPAYRGPITPIPDALPAPLPDAFTAPVPDASSDTRSLAGDAPGSADATRGPGTIMGGIGGMPFPVAVAWRIGKPSSAQTVIVLIQTALTCADLSTAGWDKTIGSAQVLEIQIRGTTARTYQVGVDATVNYLRATANPDASSGQAALERIDAGGIASGSFHFVF